MLRKIIAAAAFAASAAGVIAPGAALAQRQGHGSWPAQGGHGVQNGDHTSIQRRHGGGGYGHQNIGGGHGGGGGYNGYFAGNGGHRQQRGHAQSYGYSDGYDRSHDRGYRGH